MIDKPLNTQHNLTLKSKTYCHYIIINKMNSYRNSGANGLNSNVGSTTGISHYRNGRNNSVPQFTQYTILDMTLFILQ